jgi:RNase P subunit RPR2
MKENLEDLNEFKTKTQLKKNMANNAIKCKYCPQIKPKHKFEYRLKLSGRWATSKACEECREINRKKAQEKRDASRMSRTVIEPEDKPRVSYKYWDAAHPV